MTGTTPHADRDAVAEKLAAPDDQDRSSLLSLMDNPAKDDSLIDGLHRHLDLAATGRFLNALKLEKLGEWLGSEAPSRLQMRLMEAARSSQHPAYAAFKTGLTRSGGLERAFPKSQV